MTNPMINPQPNYSGVTIQISNPAVNVGQNGPQPVNTPGFYNGQYGTNPMYYNGYNQNPGMVNSISQPFAPVGANNQGYLPDSNNQPQQLPGQAYPAQYYLNNYNYQGSGGINQDPSGKENAASSFVDSNPIQDPANALAGSAQKESPADSKLAETKVYDVPEAEEQDFTKSQSVINDLDARAEAMEAEKQNTKEKRVVALTDEYIKSLENYLNNPNDEIRLMASKEILIRLDEDKNRFDDAALNALLNKMLQDPSKLIRVAALSAFASQLASGNDYTVTLLHNIQANPNADKEDVLQAADILLKMSAGTEIKHIPNPAVKDDGKKE